MPKHNEGLQGDHQARPFTQARSNLHGGYCFERIRRDKNNLVLMVRSIQVTLTNVLIHIGHKSLLKVIYHLSTLPHHLHKNNIHLPQT